MACKSWGRQICEYVDGSLSFALQSHVREHLRTCSSCSALASQLEQLRGILAQVDTRLEPPAHLWRQIERKILERNSTARKRWIWTDLFSWLEPRRVGYALAASVFAVTLIFTLHLRRSDSERTAIIAELDAFDLQIQENPFLGPVGSGNPFYSIDTPAQGNPFRVAGSVSK